MKKLLYISIILPLFVFSQTEETFSIVDELYNQIEVNNPAITKSFSEGWNMFGYPCQSENDVEQSFLSIIDNVIIVKDNSGSAYLPEWDYNGIGNLVGGEGYQAKVLAPINDFSFCDGVVLPNIEELDSINFFQISDSSIVNNFYKGLLEVDNYNISWNLTDGWSPVLNIEILGPNEIMNSLFLELYIHVNGENYRLSGFSGLNLSLQSPSSVLDIPIHYPTDFLIIGDVLDFTYLTTAGIFTVRKVVDEEFYSNYYSIIEEFYSNYYSIIMETSYEESYLEEACFSEYVACPYDIFLEYSSSANVHDEYCCQTLVVYGCMDYLALNYNSEANVNEGCDHIYGCMDAMADNYNEQATSDDNSCIISGCTDTEAGNFNPYANTDDGSCLIGGCVFELAENYNVDAVIDDGTCIIYGCTLSSFPNYNSQANNGDGSCDMSSTDVFGCTDESTWTYQDFANTDNGTCIYSEPQIGDLAKGGIVFYLDETGQHGLVAAMEDLGQFGWGCCGTYISGADGQAIGTGYQNTLDIVSGCSGTPIAASEALAYELVGYSDWFLPSKDELVEMYNTIGNGGLEGNIGGFDTSFSPCYWSSSENDNYHAWGVYFSNGNTSSTLKLVGTVRVIRSF